MVIEFLKSFIFPLKMRKYRNMSALIAILIFVLSIYLLLFSYRTATNNQKDDYIKNNELNVLNLYELNDPDFDYSVIQNMNYIIKERKLFSDTATDEGKTTYTINYVENGENRVVNIVFDPNEIVQEDIENLYVEYKEMFGLTDQSSKDELNKGKNVAKLFYIENIKNSELDKETRFNELKALSSDMLSKEVAKHDIFELYNLTSSEETIDTLVVFNKSTMGYSSEDKNQKVIDGVITYSSEEVLDISGYENIDEFGKGLTDYIMNINVTMMQNQQTFTFIITILFLPIVLVLILWLFYRKNGTLKRYKEYYNICAMSSVVPTLFTFLVCFFWPNVLTFHIALILIYYLFMLYRINSVQLDVD